MRDTVNGQRMLFLSCLPSMWLLIMEASLRCSSYVGCGLHLCCPLRLPRLGACSIFLSDGCAPLLNDGIGSDSGATGTQRRLAGVREVIGHCQRQIVVVIIIVAQSLHSRVGRLDNELIA